MNNSDLENIRGEKYKLAGITVYQKGTLVDVFAKFARIGESVDDILANKREPRKTPKAKPGTLGAVLDGMEPMPREFTMPALSVKDITDAIVGPQNLAGRKDHVRLTDTPGVIADLGPEKLAQVLVEMGKARRQVIEDGLSTFVRQIAAPKP